MTRTIAILLLSVSSVAIGQSSPKKYFEESKKLTDSKEYQKALTSIDIALQKDSLNRLYLLQKTKILFFSNKCGDAMHTLNLVIENVDATIQDDVMGYFCDIDDCLGKQEEATRLLEKYVLHKQYQSNEMVIYLAIRLCNFKNYEDGISYYRIYKELRPDDIESILDFARIIYSYEGSENGINEIKNGLRNNPNNLQLRQCLVSFYNYNKDYEKAIEVQNQIIQSHYTVENLKVRAILFSQIGKQDKAYDDLNSMVELEKCNPEYYSKILQYEFDTRMYEKVVSTSLKVINCDPNAEGSVLDGLYTSLFFLNETKKGEFYLDKKLALHPTNFNPYYLKSIILLKNKQFENVMNYLDLSLKATDLESPNVINVHFLKLSYYLLSEDYEGFKNYFNAAQIKSLDNKLHFTFSESAVISIPEFTVDFDKKTGIINSKLVIPSKILSLLINKYGLRIELSK